MVNFIVQNVPVGIHKLQIFTDQPRLKKILQLSVEDEEGLVGPGDGDLDWAYAKLFVDRFGGRIISGDEPIGDPNLIY